jgi:hypothetical protein
VPCGLVASCRPFQRSGSGLSLSWSAPARIPILIDEKVSDVEETMDDERWSTIISELKADVPVDIEATGKDTISVTTADAHHSLTEEEAGELLRQLENLDYERYGPPSVGTREAAARLRALLGRPTP